MSNPINHKTIAWHIDRRRQKRALKRGYVFASSRGSKLFWRDDQWMRAQWRNAGYDVPVA